MNSVVQKKIALVTNVGSGKMSSNYVAVHNTYKEKGTNGPMRVFVYVNDEKVADHLAEDLQDAVRIKENYESSLNISLEFQYTKPS